MARSNSARRIEHTSGSPFGGASRSGNTIAVVPPLPLKGVRAPAKPTHPDFLNAPNDPPMSSITAGFCIVRSRYSSVRSAQFKPR